MPAKNTVLIASVNEVMYEHGPADIRASLDDEGHVNFFVQHPVSGHVFNITRDQANTLALMRLAREVDSVRSLLHDEAVHVVVRGGGS